MKYDLVVIGAGSGGVRAARMAAQAGQKVAVIEYQALGGTCVNIGCVPKKLFVYASHFSETFEDARGFGWQSSESSFSWQSLLKNKNEEIERLNSIYGTLLENAGVELIRGKATLVDEHQVAIDGGNRIYGERILIATGSTPFVPDIAGKEWVDTSEEMFYLEELPKKILIVGGGYIAVEFAGIFNGLGVDTHLVYRGDLFLRGFDMDVRKSLYKEMSQKGIQISFGDNVQQVKKIDSTLQVNFESGALASFDRVLYATGRIPNTQSLGLENVGVETDQGAIVVNDTFKTSVDSIYALGDVIDRVQLTPVAIEEAMILVNHLYGDGSREMDYSNIPSAVFSQPNFASVGLTEEDAIELSTKKGFELDVYVSDFKAMKFSLTENPERTFMKLLVNRNTDKVLGAHMLGDSAAEIIQGIAIAIKAGATKKDFDATIGIHPSSAEEFVTLRTARG